VDAAGACFSRRGFHQTTMHDICGEAALSPGAVYRYFGSKEDIIAAMMSERQRQGVAMVNAIAHERHDTLDVLDELADVFFSRLEDAQGCAVDIELWAEAQTSPRVQAMLRDDMAAIRLAFEEIVLHAQRHGEINPDLDARSVAEVMKSFFHGLILQKSLEPGTDIWNYVAVIKAMMGGTFWMSTKKGV